MTDETYYIAPSQEIFDEVKAKSIEIWKGYDNTYGYVDEKIERINKLDNYGDNCCHIVGMFDPHNQRKLVKNLSISPRKWVEGLLEYYRSQY